MIETAYSREILADLFVCRDIYAYVSGDAGDIWQKLSRLFDAYWEICGSERREVILITHPLDFRVINPERAGLIVAQNTGMVNRDVIQLVKLRFQRIVDGYKLITCFGQPLMFHLAVPRDVKDIYKKEAECDLALSDLSKTCRADKTFVNYYSLARYYQDKRHTLQALDAFKTARRLADSSGEERLADEQIRLLERQLNDCPPSDWECAVSMEKAILFNYWGRSGSFYIASLLDGHPELCMLPLKVLYDPYISLLALFYGTRDVSLETFVQAFRVQEPDEVFDNRMVCFRLGGPLYPPGYEKAYLALLTGLFKEQAWRNNGYIHEKFLLQAQFYAHWKAMELCTGGTRSFMEGIPAMVLQMEAESGQETIRLMQLFPRAVQLVTVRHMIVSFGSLLAGMKRMGKLSASVALKILDYLAEPAVLCTRELAERSVLLRIEDVNKELIPTLQSLCATLCIRWDESLLISTVNRQRFFDRYEYDGKNQGEKGLSKRYSHLLNTLDYFRLEVLFRDALLTCKYDAHTYLDEEVLIRLLACPFLFEEALFAPENRIQLRRVLQKKCSQLLHRSLGKPENHLRLAYLIEPVR